MDGCCHGRTRRNKGHIGNKSGPGRAQLGRTNVIIHRGNTSGCKRGARRRTRNRRTQIPSSKTSVLRFNSMQVPVSTLSKDSVRGVYGILEATTLLSRVFDISGLRSTPEQHYKQPRRDGQDCKMGHRALTIRHNLQTTASYKVARSNESQTAKETSFVY